jgi:excinuclease ABC subunit C
VNVTKHIHNLKDIAHSLPENPGVYQYYDVNGKLIYVGKAKNLRKRVTSYFVKIHDSNKTNVLVKKIHDIRHIVVDTEQDALLLENNLIKEHQPRYNILLKDDKTFPWIVIKNEPFPRVFKTRTFIKDGSEYFGPYTSGHMVNTLLSLIRQLFKVRTCKLGLTEKLISKQKFKPCLELHIGNCKGPCIGLYSYTSYMNDVGEIRKILKGNISEVKGFVKTLMLEASAKMEYEKAAEFKERYDLLEKYQSKSTIVNQKISNVDVFSILNDGAVAYVNYLKVQEGSIIHAHNIEVKKFLDEPDDDLLLTAIIDLRLRFNSLSDEILVPFSMNFELPGITFTVPVIGDKKKLLDFSQKNLTYFKLEKLKQNQQLSKSQRSTEKLSKLQADLQIPVLPLHIECFDNSNLQGTNPVAACVVFKNGKPAKKEYRHFNVKSVEGPDDFASMKEIVFRRYSRLISEGGEIPQLIVIDGGKGQLSAAVSALDDVSFERRPSIIGIAKRLEEIYRPGDPVPLYLDKNSGSLKLLQQLRDEAHRFGITFHRQKRSSNFISSNLESIPGIGPKTAEKLLSDFGSLANLAKASEEDIVNSIGSAKALIVINYLKNSVL